MSFTKQAAHRYIENLVISLANFDILGDSTKMPKWAAPFIEGENATSTPKMLLAGLAYTISLCTENIPTFSRYRAMPSDDVEKDCLPGHIMDHLVQHCLHHMPDGRLPRWTEIISSKHGY